MNLKVNIAGIEFKNPVTVASGTFGFAEKYYNPKEMRKIGALIPKTVTLYPQGGNPPPRIVETPAGMINAIGIDNVGADLFIETKLPVFQKIGVPLVVSISANSEEDFVALAQKFDGLENVRALELNLSCPNLQKKVLISQDVQLTKDIIRKIKRAVSLPVFAKLSPNVTDITKIALAAEDSGAEAISLVNTFSAMDIDIEQRRPSLGNITGGLSGPCIRPIALYMVYQVARKAQIPIIAMGGIMNASDALRFLIAGAKMVAVGTANFVNPKAPVEIIEGIKAYMRKHKMKDVREVIGSIKV